MDRDENKKTEIDDLKKEIEHFKQEKERVKSIIGQIGGMPSLDTKMHNIIFVIFCLICFAISLVSHGKLQLAMIELAIAAVSVKLIFLIYWTSRVNHFQLWILSSMEWRMNEIMKLIKHIEKKDETG
ncbi:hypothetical protein N9934_00565 [Desulfosarcina sp.]|nr:hypothetical protein [Desulfosarcina sp.]